MTDWRPFARALADQLRERGDLVSPQWHAAVASTPRHVLVPRAWRQDAALDWVPVDLEGADGLARVYSPRTLITGVEHGAAVSSSTKPDLVVRMLELADVADDSRVLEIGTGTGYHAALLCHRLGAARVSSVDVDAELVAAARSRLAAIGHRPRLRAADGFDGDPDAAPFDRIIATCSVTAVPPAWPVQLGEGGRLLVTLSAGPRAGTLAVLHRRGDVTEGRFVPREVSFMPLRRPGLRTEPRPARRGDPPTTHRTTTLPAEPWRESPVAWFWACLDLPGLQVAYVLDDDRTPSAVRLTTPDGSSAQLPVGTGERPATVVGDRPVLDVVEHAWARWRSADRPGWERVGVTVTAEGQWTWLDDPRRGPRRELGADRG